MAASDNLNITRKGHRMKATVASDTPGQARAICGNGYHFADEGQELCACELAKRAAGQASAAIPPAVAQELLEALRSILEIGKRDLSNPKYDSYFDSASAAVVKAEASIGREERER